MAAKASASLFMVSLSALVLVLFSYRKQREMVIGTVTTGQIHPILRGLIRLLRQYAAAETTSIPI